jgi:hypothetical protein
MSATSDVQHRMFYSIFEENFVWLTKSVLIRPGIAFKGTVSPDILFILEV